MQNIEKCDLRAILMRVLKNNETTKAIADEKQIVEELVKRLKTPLSLQPFTDYLHSDCGSHQADILYILSSLVEDAAIYKQLGPNLLKLWLRFKAFDILDIRGWSQEAVIKRKEITQVFRTFSFPGSSLEALILKCGQTSGISLNAQEIKNIISQIDNDKLGNIQALFERSNHQSQIIPPSQSNLRGLVNQSTRSLILQPSTKPEVMETYKILILGNTSVGKSCFLIQFIDNKFNLQQQPTITSGDRRQKMLIVEDTKLNLTMWDTAGQETFRSLTKHHYRNTQGIILVYDITSRESFNGMDSWLEEIDRNVGLTNVDILIVGNKTDLKDKRVVPESEGFQFAFDKKFDFMEVSAKDSTNINYSFQVLAKRMMKNKGHNERKKTTTGSKLYVQEFKRPEMEKKEKKNCCLS